MPGQRHALWFLIALLAAGATLAIGSANGAALSRTAETAPAATAATTVRTRLRAHANDRNTRVPILMYHVIGDAPGGAPFPELYVRAADFTAQMRWLARHGFSAVTLRHVWDHWHASAPLPRRPVVVSFDDGYRSTAEIALPTLREHGWPAVLNLKTRSLDVTWGLASRQIRMLISAGWEIDAHSLTHPDLTIVDDDRLDLEVAGSRRLIRRLFGVRVDFFCYPSGRFDDRVIAAVKRAGYLGATTTVEGLARSDEAYRLRRVRVSRSDGVAGLASGLALAQRQPR